MRRALPFLVLIVLTLIASPALAERYTLTRPSPCDRPIPTGRAVPRQGIIDAVGDVLMLGTVTPTWRDKPIGLAGKDERVTILQECGFSLRIRNVRGLEGWIHVVAISDERKAWEAAKNRPPASIADCDILYIDPVTSDRCKIKFQAEQNRRDEVVNSAYLSEPELRRFVTGRTLTMEDRHRRPSDRTPPVRIFLADNGEYFELQGKPSDNLIDMRNRYELRHDVLCFRGMVVICSRLRKVGDELIWTTPHDQDFTVVAADGDPYNLVAEVSKAHPAPVMPRAPAGAEDVSGPQL